LISLNKRKNIKNIILEILVKSAVALLPIINPIMIKILETGKKSLIGTKYSLESKKREIDN